eukprot:GHUV01036134.1.p1 GENE.GHUV01036134.1~~GHUV01036134.1.p1  ORF type:complete len:115 (+),score=22.03 GHUV01036134.1:600-944(+)
MHKHCRKMRRREHSVHHKQWVASALASARQDLMLCTGSSLQLILTGFGGLPVHVARQHCPSLAVMTDIESYWWSEHARTHLAQQQVPSDRLAVLVQFSTALQDRHQPGINTLTS